LPPKKKSWDKTPRQIAKTPEKTSAISPNFGHFVTPPAAKFKPVQKHPPLQKFPRPKPAIAKRQA
jgi:hypothetical protein